MSDATEPPSRTQRMLIWYGSWFRMSGTLDLAGYAKHIIAAFAFFFGIGFLGPVFLFLPLVGALIALQAPAWASYLPLFLICLPLQLLGFCSWVGILVASTTRFVRHLRGMPVSYATSTNPQQ